MNQENDNLVSDLDKLIDEQGTDSIRDYTAMWNIYERAFPDASERDIAKMVVLCITVITWAIEQKVTINES